MNLPCVGCGNLVAESEAVQNRFGWWHRSCEGAAFLESEGKILAVKAPFQSKFLIARMDAERKKKEAEQAEIQQKIGDATSASPEIKRPITVPEEPIPSKPDPNIRPAYL